LAIISDPKPSPSDPLPQFVRWGLVWWSLAMLASPAQAAESLPMAAGVAFSDTLVVVSRSLADPVNPSVSGLVTRIELADEPEWRDAGDLLGRAAGIQVRRYGAVGASAVPSLRGSSGAQVRLFLDGMPLNDAQNGLAGLDRIPLDRTEAIEIHRGVVPTGLGGIGGSGAVNFLTRTEDEGFDFLARAGSFGEIGARAAAGLANDTGTRSLVFLVHGLRADNDYSYLDHNQTFYNSADDSVRTRENAWINQWGVWGAGTLGTGRLVSRLTLGHDRRDGGRPGPLGHLSPNASVRYESTDGQLHLDLDEGLLQLNLAGGRREEFLYDPEGEVGFGTPGTDRSVSGDLFGRLIWAPELVAGLLSLQTGVEGLRQRQQDWSPGLEEPLRERQTLSSMATATVDLAHGRFQVAPAWRWQRNRDDFPPVPQFPWLPENEAVLHSRDDVSPSLGLVWALVAERFFLESHVARTVRQPTWVELFGHRGGIDGNRELQPEEISSADVAVSLRSAQGGFSGRLAGFQAETDEKIIFIQNSQRTSKAINAGRTRTRGIECELVTRLPGQMTLTGNFTYQDAEDLGGLDLTYQGNKLPFLPDVEGQARLKWRPTQWTLWAEVAHMGANYRDRANTELNIAPARTLLNLGVAWDWHPQWLGPAGVVSVITEVVNLTDNAVYDVEGFPLPGRSWHLAARVRI
jgi:outer membrane cobalamin receptor